LLLFLVWALPALCFSTYEEIMIKHGFVNARGFAAIKNWIESTALIDDAGLVHGTDQKNLDAWADDIERHLNDMENGPWCEMNQWSTRSGHTEQLILTDDCLDWFEVIS